MSASVNDTSRTATAQEVGWIFVREYFKHLHEKPDSLCHFYDKQSSLIRGLEGQEVKICRGQQEIQSNIAEMQLKDAKAVIINVDSLDLYDGKIVVQVIGEISNKGEAYKKFVWTVILTKPTDDNYYILSDIFRYLKDENVEVIKQQSIDQESSYIEDGVSTLNEEKSAGEDTVSSTGTLNEESAHDSNRELKGIEDSVPDIPSTKASVNETPSLARSLARSSTEDMIVVDKNANDSEKSNSSDTRSKSQPGPISVQTEKLATTPSNATNQIISPTESRSPSKSWANLAASDPQKWSNSQLAESKGRVVQSQLTRTQSQQSNRERDQRGGSTVNREFSLYVRGITEAVGRNALEKAFMRFGNVKNLDVVPSKSCAFVEFGDQEAYQQALAQKQIDIPNFGTVSVEERKPKDDSVNNNNRRGSYHRNYNYNGINSQRGGRGGGRHNSRPPAKS